MNNMEMAMIITRCRMMRGPRWTFPVEGPSSRPLVVLRAARLHQRNPASAIHERPLLSAAVTRTPLLGRCHRASVETLCPPRSPASRCWRIRCHCRHRPPSGSWSSPSSEGSCRPWAAAHRARWSWWFSSALALWLHRRHCWHHVPTGWQCPFLGSAGRDSSVLRCKNRSSMSNALSHLVGTSMTGFIVAQLQTCCYYGWVGILVHASRTILHRELKVGQVSQPTCLGCSKLASCLADS